MKKNLLLLSFLAAFLASPAVYSFEDLQPSPWIDKEPYVEKSINKLGFGLLNTLTGWTAVLFEPTRYDNKFTGLAKGLWRTVTNTTGGALHAVTFLIPVDIPLPEGGVSFE